jgi:hypothetical protein
VGKISPGIIISEKLCRKNIQVYWKKYPNVTHRKKISPEEILNGTGRNILTYIWKKISPEKISKGVGKMFSVHFALFPTIGLIFSMTSLLTVHIHQTRDKV